MKSVWLGRVGGLVGFLLLGVGAIQVADPGSALREGMIIVYGNDAGAVEWSIDSLERNAIIAGRDSCVRFSLRIGTNAPAKRVFCREGDVIHTLRTDGQLAATRPITVRSRHETRSPSGSVTEYVVGEQSIDTIGGSAIAVLPTTITTLDSTGRAVRRLTERFSVGLLTAVNGTFAVADSTQPDGWRTTQRFSITSIR